MRDYELRSLLREEFCGPHTRVDSLFYNFTDHVLAGSREGRSCYQDKCSLEQLQSRLPGGVYTTLMSRERQHGKDGKKEWDFVELRQIDTFISP